MAHNFSKKRLHQMKGAAPNSEINVTPLVDVVLVLLIIFMVVTPLLERDLQVRVPQSTEETPAENSSVQQVVVGITPEGNFMLNLEFVDAAEYVDKLRDVLSRREDKTVFFLAEDSASYEALVTALDGAKAAGAQILGMMTDAPQVPPMPPPPAPEGAAPLESPAPEMPSP